MRFLPDERLYTDTAACLDWLATLPPRDEAAADRERCHLYWYGAFSRKQAFAVKSFLATQDLDRTELWLWLDGEDGWAGHEENPLLGPFLPHLQVRRFDPDAETAGTPLERRPELYRSIGPVERSDLFRHVVLFRHGGLYADIDAMFLRDLHELPAEAEELCYRWSASVPHANSAFMRLRRESDVAGRLLARCAERGSCHPREVLSFDRGDDLDLLVLPCPVFDPAWLRNDRIDRYRAAPVARFEDFFRPFGLRFRQRPDVRSYRDFFPGAFVYHWHNLWAAAERRDSYFGVFEEEFDAILADRLGISPSGPG